MTRIINKIKLLFRILPLLKNRTSYIKDLLGFQKRDWLLHTWDASYHVRHGTPDRWIVTETAILDDYKLHNLIDTDYQTVIDLGGYIGDFSIIAAKKLKKAMIHVFEPNTGNYELLLKNIELNGLIDRIKPVKGVVTGEHALEVDLYENLDQGLNSVINFSKETPSYIKQFTDKASTQHNKVMNFHFEKLKELIKGKTLLKMDIEGGEYTLFKKENLELIKMVDIIVMEYHDLDSLRNGDSIERFLLENNISLFVRTRTFFYIFVNNKVNLTFPHSRLLFYSRPFQRKTDNAGEQSVARHLSRKLSESFNTKLITEVMFPPNLSISSLVFYDYVLVLYYAFINIFVRYKVVFFNSPFNAFFSFLFRLGGSKTVVLINDMFFLKNEKLTMYDMYSHILYWMTAFGCDFLISTTKETANEVSEYYGKKCIAINLGLSEFFDHVTEVQLNTKIVERKFCYIGAYEKPRKRTDRIIELLKLSNNTDFKYFFAGPIKADFKAELEKLTFTNFDILGVISEQEKLNLFLNSSFIYFPTRLEGTGLPIVEALRTGVLPIMHEDALVPDEVKSYCVLINKPVEVKAVVEKYMTEPELFSRAIVKNYRHSLSFDYTRFVVYLMGLYA
jgi:FkbM family methyltransferase